MKSIVEEASSVAKAIEKGWIQAGKPQEFSIKVFEIEQKNFLGMTLKPAKIAIFYTDKPAERASTRHDAHDNRRTQSSPKRDSRQQEVRPQPKKDRPSVQQAEPVQPKQSPIKAEEQVEQSGRGAWSDEMVKFCEQWLKSTLSLMNIDKAFSIEVKNYYLKISFSQALLPDEEREKLLFRSFAYLIMQSLRNKFKKGFRGFKIILNSGR